MPSFISSFAHNTIIRELFVFFLRFEPRRKWIIKKYLKSTKEPKLQIGCGPNMLDGWLNTGISLVECYRGVYLDAGKPFPLPDSSFNYIYSEHLFEHLTYKSALNMLHECYRVLKPGGIIRIATPDLSFLIGLYMEPEKPIHKEYIEYTANNGNLPASPVYVISRFHTDWGHQIIYDKETLRSLLNKTGFKDICSCEVGQSSHHPLKDVEQHFRYLPYQFNLLETMILEASK